MTTRRHLRVALLAAVLYLVASRAWAAGPADPVVPLLLGLAVVLIAGRVGGWLAARAGQPPVLGELIGGIVLGNLGLLGFHALEPLKTDPLLGVLSSLGVILLLFEIGLESTAGQMMRVGASSLLVACLGVATPFALGWLVGAWLLPEHSPYVHAFLGAVLTATSVGITARVLRDLGESTSDEARIILGAAVIDDVLGLIILAVVSGAITAADQGQSLSLGAVAWITLKAVGFLGAAIVIGRAAAPWLFRVASRVRVPGSLLVTSLVFCFLLAYLASRAGLAPIVGAFAAGLVLEPAAFRAFEERGEPSLEAFLRPITLLLVPVFFVLTGLRVDLAGFADVRVVGLAAALIGAAWVGKQACMLGVLDPGVDRVSVGLGMVPRGEVGLIFANIGAALLIGGERVITPSTYAAVVGMVVVTTLVTPPALQWSLRRARSAGGRRPARRLPDAGT